MQVFGHEVEEPPMEVENATSTWSQLNQCTYLVPFTHPFICAFLSQFILLSSPPRASPI